MPVTFSFVVPSGKVYSPRKIGKQEILKNRKPSMKDFNIVLKNSVGKKAQFDLVEVTTSTLVTRGAEELIGVINCSAIVFQRLVSRTPIDEEYDYINYAKVRQAIAEGNGNEEFDYKDFVEHHTPDAERIRDHWELTINVNGTQAVQILSKDFNDDLFLVCNDSKAINEIASVIGTKFKSNISVKEKNLYFDYDIVFKNNSSYFDKLEYGKYKRTVGGAHQGKNYLHGITNGYTFQAPNGFYRKTLLELNNLLNKRQSRDVSKKLMQYYVGKNPDLKKNIEKWFKKFPNVDSLKRFGVDIKFDDLKLGDIIDEVVKLASKDDSLRAKMMANAFIVKSEYGTSVEQFENIISDADYTPGMTIEEYAKKMRMGLSDQYDINYDAITFHGGKDDGDLTSTRHKNNIKRQRLEFESARDKLLRNVRKEHGLDDVKMTKASGEFVTKNRKYSIYSKRYPNKNNRGSNLQDIVLVGKKTKETVVIKKKIENKYLSASGLKRLLADEIYKANRPLYKKRKNIGNALQREINKKRKRRLRK